MENTIWTRPIKQEVIVFRTKPIMEHTTWTRPIKHEAAVLITEHTKEAGRFYRRLQGRASGTKCSGAPPPHSQIEFEGRVLGSHDCRAKK
jgi:hypothetical protein